MVQQLAGRAGTGPTHLAARLCFCGDALFFLDLDRAIANFRSGIHPGTRNGGGNSRQNEAGKPGAPYFVHFVVALILGGTLCTFAAISLGGGWFQLGRRFPAPRGYKVGQRFFLQSAGLGAVGYNKVLTVRVGPKGLYLACPFPFNFMHRPLLIPWDEVKSVGHPRILLSRRGMLRLSIGSPKLISLFFSKKNIMAAIEPFLPER